MTISVGWSTGACRMTRGSWRGSMHRGRSCQNRVLPGRSRRPHHSRASCGSRLRRRRRINRRRSGFASLQVSRDMITRPAADETMNMSPTANMMTCSFWWVEKNVTDHSCANTAGFGSRRRRRTGSNSSVDQIAIGRAAANQNHRRLPRLGTIAESYPYLRVSPCFISPSPRDPWFRQASCPYMRRTPQKRLKRGSHGGSGSAAGGMRVSAGAGRRAVVARSRGSRRTCR